MTDALDPIAIDLGDVLRGSVASLYAHLVTRPTGRAVRMAIEDQLQGGGAPSVSLIDFSEVAILDFSCADEVVAKLLQKYGPEEVEEAFFVFRGVHEPHRDQIEVVLERHGLAAVAETAPGRFELIGVFSQPEADVWAVLESSGVIERDRLGALVGDRLPVADADAALTLLAARRLAFESAVSGRVHALSRLIEHLI